MPTMNRILTLFFAALTFASYGFVGKAKAEGDVKIERVSDRLYLVPDPKAKTIDFQVVVNAGCYDEANNSCNGIAHYLEHIILIGRNSGSTDIAFRFFPDAMANGWTNNFATSYIHKVPLKGGAPEPILEKLFDFYAKRLTGFEISTKDAERERNVVQQEYDWRYGSKPESLFLLKAAALEIPQHPHDQSAAGTPADIAAFSVEAARTFHQRWYSKNNAHFIVTGNISAEKLKEIAEKALADTPGRPVPAHVWRATPNYKLETVTVSGSDKQTARTRIYMSKIYRVADADYYKTQAAQNILQSFLSSKLPESPYSVLVERETLATDVSIAVQFRVPGVYEFDLTATLADDVTPETLMKAMTRYTDNMANLSLSEATVIRLKKRFADGWKDGQDNAERVTSRLVQWLARDLPYDELAKIPERVSAIAVDDIRVQSLAIAAKGRVVFAILQPGLSQSAITAPALSSQDTAKKAVQ